LERNMLTDYVFRLSQMVRQVIPSNVWSNGNVNTNCVSRIRSIPKRHFSNTVDVHAWIPT
jgi:hypothetical protein